MSDQEWKFVQYDVELEAVDDPKGSVEVAEALVDALQHKGFCVLNAKARIEALVEGGSAYKDADHEVKMLEESGRFERPAAQVVQGLLGQDGSLAVCEIETGLGPDADDGEEAGVDGPTLQRLDRVLNTTMALLRPVSEASLGLSFGGRTAPMLHISGEREDEEEEEPKFTETEADKWLSLFVNQRYMLLLCLGPGKGHLELRPFRHEDAPLYVVSTEPGTLVVLRSDTLTQRYYSYDRSVVLTSWLAQTTLDEQRADAGADEEALNPAARGLMAWISERMRALKEREIMGAEGPTYDGGELPREWQSAMNHTYLRGATCSVRGMACKIPGTWDPYNSLSPLIYGGDVAHEVPMMRWKHEDHYNPDPESWKYFKIYAKHGCFIEGGELFDPKPFGLAVYEAKGMDPCQRHILETSYEALMDAGFGKKQLMRSLIGVYIGAAVTEFQMAENCNEGVGTSCAGAITSNRISFCLGLQGPSFTTDLGGASSLASIAMAVNSLRFQTDLYKANHTAVPGAVNLLLAPQYYVLACAAGFLSQVGRSQTFDVSASGYCRGEGVGAATLKDFAEIVDGVPVRDESRPWHGNISAVYTNHVGHTASLTSPSGPREAEIVAECVRQASLSPLDVDMCECWGESGILSDAVAVKATTSALRGGDDAGTTTLGLSSVQSGFGYMQESSGMMMFFKAIFANKYNVQVPTVHLLELNPHIDAWEGEPLNFHTEAVPFKHVSAFVDLGSKSNSGTLSHVITWGEVDCKKITPRKRWKRDAIAFWPAGGGELPEGAEPRKTYYIAGSWSGSEWTEPAAMQNEGDGVFGYTLTLGANCFEHFQIWLDGDSERVLHPGMAFAPKNLPVLGPASTEECGGSAWLIDGREQTVIAVPALTGAGGGQAAIADEAAQPVESLYEHRGSPGDQYRVRLHVAGKWRTVDWKLVESAASKEVSDDGKYYVCASWTGWAFTEMAPDSSRPGVHRAEVTLPGFHGEFQIVRNKDWYQVFTPSLEEKDAVEGPDDGSAGGSWLVNGKPWDKIAIEFQRSWKGGVESRSLSWQKAAE